VVLPVVLVVVALLAALLVVRAAPGLLLALGLLVALAPVLGKLVVLGPAVVLVVLSVAGSSETLLECFQQNLWDLAFPKAQVQSANQQANSELPAPS
jgi:hypothetical protein